MFEGKTQTLHELWDAGMLDTENGQRERWQDYLMKSVTRTTAQRDKPTEWANESITHNRACLPAAV